MANQWAHADHALSYLAVQDQVPHRTEGEVALLEFLPASVQRVLDLGTGDGRLLDLVLSARPGAAAVAVDFSPAMLDACRARFAGRDDVEVVSHDLSARLPHLGRFDAVVSSFAIHHVTDERKKTLTAEVYDRVASGGVFLNLEHVSSPSPRLHREFMATMGIAPDDEDPSNLLLEVETQLRWLREAGFADVDCHWKWRELALLGGVRR